jgi:hypothetical protein
MQKEQSKQVVKAQQRDETASVIASIFDLTPRAVRMVIQGETINEPVLEAVMITRKARQNSSKRLKNLCLLRKRKAFHSPNPTHCETN